MSDRAYAKDIVQTLALKNKSIPWIQAELERQGLGGVLYQFEIQEIVTEVRAAVFLTSKMRRSRVLPRVIGVIAIVMGGGASLLGGSLFYARYSPEGWGLIAIILGLTLIINPEWGYERLK